METSENPAEPVHSGPRGHSSETNTTRGRKRDRSALTTPVGGSAFRDSSKDWLIDFKKPRCLPPVEGSDVRERSNDRFILFKKPRLPNVSVGKMTTPTPSLTPPSAPLAQSKAWADYDEEDDRRVYEEEDPSTLFLEIDPPLSHCASDDPLPPLDSRITFMDQLTVDLPPLDFSLPERAEEAEEMPQSETPVKRRSTFSPWSDFYIDDVDKGKVKQRIVQLLRREDERSREQDSGEHLEKKQDHIDLFRDIEEAGKTRRRIYQALEFFGLIFQRSPLFREDQDVAEARFLFLGDKDRLRGETQRLRRYQKLLEQWSEAFTREEHDVSVQVGVCLMDVLAEVHKDISYLTKVGRLQPQCLPSKNCMSLSAYRKMKKRMMEKLRLNMDEFRRREWYSPYQILLSFKNYDTTTALSTMGRFYQSSSGKTRRSLSVRNTRKYLRRLHTMTAGGALRRGRRRLTDGGLKLCSRVTHSSGLSLKPADCTNLSTSRISHSQSLTLN